MRLFEGQRAPGKAPGRTNEIRPGAFPSRGGSFDQRCNPERSVRAEQWTDLDAAVIELHLGELLGKRNGRVEVGCLEQIEAANHFLRLGERAVSHRGPAAGGRPGTQGDGGCLQIKRGAEQNRRASLLVEGSMPLVDPLLLLRGHRFPTAFIAVAQGQELSHGVRLLLLVASDGSEHCYVERPSAGSTISIDPARPAIREGG